MAITAEQIRDEFGFYKAFVFEFLYMTVVDEIPTPVTYICKHDPEGITSENIQHIRNRAKYGVFRSFTTDLSFISEDIDWIKAYIATYHYEGNLLLNIYELNNSTAEYSLLYSGKVELSKYKIENYKMKLTLGDSDLGALIDNNGDKEFSITPAEYTPFLKDLNYGGIPIVEQGHFTCLHAYDDMVIPTSYPDQYGNDVYLCPDLLPQRVDALINQFNQTDYEYLEYRGAPTQMTMPFFVAEKAGTLYIRNVITFTLVIPYPFLAEDNSPYNDFPHSFNLGYNSGNGDLGAGVNYSTIASGNIVYTRSYIHPELASYEFTIDWSGNFNVGVGDEVYFMLYLYRFNTTLQNFPIRVRSNINMDLIFKETPVNHQIYGIPLPDLASLALNKATNGIYSGITGINEWNKILITTGDLARKLIANSITVKLNDIIDFIVKALGQGYDYTQTGIAFDENYKFFDPSVLLQIENPTGFVEEAMTDYLYNTITVGFEPYDTEYLSGKLAMHEKTVWKTPVDSVKNDFNLVPVISANPFEIEDVVRKSNREDDLTDYESDGKLYAIWCKITDGVYSIDKLNYDLANSQSFPYSETIYNLELTPARILQRNLFNVNQSLINDTDTIKKQMRTKNEDYYSNYIGSTIPVYEGRDFMIYPRCGVSTAPRLYSPESEWRLEPVRYTMNVVPELLSSLTDRRKLILFKIDGVIRAGYIDDIGYNPNTHEPKNIKLIKAHLTQQEIDALWV